MRIYNFSGVSERRCPELGDTDVTFPGFDRVLADSTEFVESMGGIYEFEYEYNAEFESGMALNFALGYDVATNFRVEAEAAYQKNDVDGASFRLYEYIDSLIGEDYIAGESELVDNDIVSGDSSSFVLMINGYYDFANASAFTPFVTAGVGFAKVECDMSSSFIDTFIVEVDEDYSLVAPKQSGNETVLAYQLGVGCGYSLSEAFTLDVKYRYFATEDPGFGGLEIECSSSNVYLGVRFGF